MSPGLLHGKIIFWKKRFLSILTFLVVFWVFLSIFNHFSYFKKKLWNAPFNFYWNHPKKCPFGWIITFWVKKLICILSFLLFSRLRLIWSFFLIILKYIQRVISWFFTKVWKIVKNTPQKKQKRPKCKNWEKKLFFKKWFLYEGGLYPSFLLLILIDILKGNFLKNFKNLKSHTYYVRAA